MKQSRIKRLVQKRLARRIARARGTAREELERFAEREAQDTIRRMLDRGYRLITRLETGEGVFVRDTDVVGLHVQLPRSLYERLEEECRTRETTKRSLVMDALEQYLGG